LAVANRAITKLAQRAASVFAERQSRRHLTYLEHALLEEIELALAGGQREVLAALDRLRERAALKQDPRVRHELLIARYKTELRTRTRGAA
jgi:hypothetical protein